MKLKIYQVDAFAEAVFKGNPAAVCPIVGSWPSDTLLQSIAMENNLSETAYYRQNEDGSYHIRWFTPETEVRLCGHATLATAYVIYHYDSYEGDRIHFDSLSGPLSVNKEEDLLTLDFPVDKLSETAILDIYSDAIGQSPTSAYIGRDDLILVYPDEQTIRSIDPDITLLHQIDQRGIIVTALGDEVDFVSRFFAPKCGIVEDPVTGSAHTSLAALWSPRLNKTDMTALQLSDRGGALQVSLRDDRVLISGRAVPYLTGEIHIPQ